MVRVGTFRLGPLADAQSRSATQPISLPAVGDEVVSNSEGRRRVSVPESQRSQDSLFQALLRQEDARRMVSRRIASGKGSPRSEEKHQPSVVAGAVATSPLRPLEGEPGGAFLRPEDAAGRDQTFQGGGRRSKSLMKV